MLCNRCGVDRCHLHGLCRRCMATADSLDRVLAARAWKRSKTTDVTALVAEVDKRGLWAWEGDER